ncbi:hypothetical protein [Pseudoclavibacter sp. CFCC 11306]|uniref:hypothetical protein n=1 Tax=Pseudoclavibacter sp. CFCC 11306 TaxID=1564493 RepID=UPI001300F842|nr:hypothetical protein [Pseudoclavibacter sp. CFCC 11306]KAB1658151.1 hypothetical protein F8O09_00505 [Pseudoclavibacter sp. CFCC 11306]
MTIHTPKTREALASMLAPLRLEASVFERAVSVAAAESRTFSPGAPKSAPEFTRWARTIETVHEDLMLLKLGWRRFDPDNLPYFLQPDLNLGFIVSSGDSFTGVTYGTPKNRNPKGTEFARRVDKNGAVAMFGQPTDEGEVNVDDFRVLLYNERDGLVHLEFSRPDARVGDFVSNWSERIIFPAFDLALGTFSFEENNDEGDFGFTIARR